MGANVIPIVPRLVLWAAGVVAGLAVAHLARREFRRVNDELDEARLAPARERAEHPTLRRDPRTGVYKL
ncbi:MAG: hypothetical protein AB7V13_12455 [Pseudorhodoplanes sp.]|uniref:hypothetical protein n=1 Tax=Pseudorhodoplanes sp. TaxID=1934341 RepID=UPI003D0AAFA5